MKIFSNLAISLDGRIADRNSPGLMLGSDRDKQLMQQLREKCDVIVAGAETLRVLGTAMKIDSRLPRRSSQPANAIVSRSGDLDAGLAFWNDPEVVRFLFVPRSGFSKAMACAQDRAFVVESGATSVDPMSVIERLKESGYQKVLVEGGGELMFAFARARLLHEIYVTLTPRLLGGRSNPSLLGGDDTLSPWLDLKLKSSRTIRDEVFLRYEVVGARDV